MAQLGRPIIYPVDEVIEKVYEFIDKARKGIVKPRLISFRNDYGIGKTRLCELRKENKDLANALELLQGMEEEYIVNGGEVGTIPAPFAKFRLQQNPFNYTDKTDLTIGNKEGETFKTEEITDLSKLSVEELINLESIIKKASES